MKNYLELLQDVVENGDTHGDRTGTGTISVFGRSMKFALKKGFPLVTTKKVNFPAIAHELLWFLSGSSNIKYLQDNGVHIWDAWANAEGELGKVYGVQWRNWETFGKDSIDQIAEVIKSLKENPFSRRHIVTAWNPDDVGKESVALPPCHILFQFNVNSKRELNCQMYQRSCDLFLGVPFNIASYSLLTHMIAAQTGLQVGEFTWVGGDCHIYLNHISQVKEQLEREYLALPNLVLKPVESIDDYKIEDILLVNYFHHSALKGAISV